MKFSEIEKLVKEDDVLFASPSMPNIKFGYTPPKPLEVSQLWSTANKEYFRACGKRTTEVQGYYTMIDAEFRIHILGHTVPMSGLINDWYIIGE
jgi:hypothetical protein